MSLVFLTMEGWLQQNKEPVPKTINLVVAPCKLPDEPRYFDSYPQRPPDREASEQHRKSMKEAMAIYLKRNVDPVQLSMEVNQPKHPSEALPWMQYQADLYKGLRLQAFEALQKGSLIPLDPELDADRNWDTDAMEGASHAIGPFWSWLVTECYADNESIWENFPRLLHLMNEWSKSLDSRIDESFEFELLTLATLPEVPNLGPALERVNSPQLQRARFFELHRDDILLQYMNSEMLAQIADLRTNDAEIHFGWNQGLQKVHAVLRARNQVDSQDEISWREELEKFRPRLIESARQSEFSSYQMASMPLERLFWLAFLADYDRFSVRHQCYFENPIPSSIATWRNDQKRLQESWSMPLPIVRSILPASQMREQPEAYWQSEQTIRLACCLFYLRDYLAVHERLPESLEQLEQPNATIDPISGRSFEYSFRSLDEAELRIVGVEKGIRLVCKLRASKQAP